MKYLVVIEETDTGYSAYSPDLNGCIATGATREQAASRMQVAVEFHLEGMRKEGLPVSKPRTSSRYVEVLSPEP